MGKIVEQADLQSLMLCHPVVLTGGTFDLFHLGHAEFLKLCKSFGKTLVILVSSDDNVKKRKGESRPVFSDKDRCKLVSYLEFVDFAFISSIRCEDRVIHRKVKADILVLSDEDKEEKIEYIIRVMLTVKRVYQKLDLFQLDSIP